MSSVLGFVDKDNDFANLSIKDIVDAKTASFDTLTVRNLTVFNTFTNAGSEVSTGSTVATLKVSNTLEVDGQLVFKSASPSNQIVFENTKTGASITLNCQPVSVLGITYNIPDVGVNFSNFVMTDGNQTINGTKTFTTMPVFPSGGGGTLFPLIFLTNTTNQITFGSGNVVVMNVPAPSSTRIYTLPDTGANSQFVMTDGTQTINGVRTYTSGLVVNATTNQLVLSSPNTVTITASSPAASRVYTLPDTGANSQFVMTDGAQTINGIKTFSSAPVFPALSLPSITLTNTSNQIALTTASAGNPLITVTAPAAAAARTYTIPDAGGAASFVMSASNQTIANNITFSGNVLLATSGGTAANLNYYEEFTSTMGFTGPFTGTINANFSIVRIGKVVAFNCAGVPVTSASGSASAIQTSAGAIPARFLPTVNGNPLIPFGVVAVGQSNSTAVNVVVVISSNGSVLLWNGLNGTNFANTGSVAVNNFVYAWNAF